LESDALPIRATDPADYFVLLASQPWRSRNFALAMQCVRAAFGAELFDRKFVRLRLFVFSGGVVARFASIA
jgi:hypothetical protein